MARMSCRRVVAIGIAVIVNVAIVSAAADAAVDMSVGTRSVVQNGAVGQCSAKAKSALNSVLTGAFEAGAGTGQWVAYGAPDSSGSVSSAAAIHCYPVDKGYVATFTCAVETPPDTDTASALCTKITTAFGGPK